MEMIQAMTEPSAADMHPKDVANLGRNGRKRCSSVKLVHKGRDSGTSAAGQMFNVINNFRIWDEEAQPSDYDAPKKTTKLVHSSSSGEEMKDPNGTVQQFEDLLKEILDGQRRLEVQLGQFSSLRPLVEEVIHDVKEMDKKLPCDSRLACSPPALSLEVPAARRTSEDGQSNASSEKDELVRDLNGAESQLSPRLLLPNSCSGYSLKDVSDFAGKQATIHVNVGGAQLQHEVAGEIWKSVCTVKLGEKKVMETSSVSGHSPEWKHEESLPYFDEDVLEFSVEVCSKSGSRSHWGKSSLQLDDCRSSGGFSGLLQLVQAAEEDESQVANVLGQLAVSVRFENVEDRFNVKRQMSALVTRTETSKSAIRPVGSQRSAGSMVHRLRHSMLAVAGTAVMNSSASRHSQVPPSPKAVQWPASIHIREGLDVQDSEASGEGEGHQAMLALQASWNPVLNSSNSNLKRGLSDGGMTSQTTRFFERCGCKMRFILDPASKKILVYDLLSLIILLHDFIVIPYYLAWEVELEGWFKISAFMSCVFWMLDIPVSFITGYVVDGQVELRWFRVVKHYLKSWFGLDVSLVLIDFICVFGNEMLVGKVTRVFRILRFVRVISLIRALRVTVNLEHVLDRSTSELSSSVSYILKVFVVILWLGHVICCTWYWIGMHASSATELTWFDTVDSTGSAMFSDSPTDYQYFTSFHWALSQISGNGVEMISPMNTAERIFNISCLVFGVLFGSALVSSLSATMVEVQMLKQEKLVKIRTVRQFLGQNEIPAKLAYRVQKQFKERIGKQKRISTMDVPELSLLSHKLRVELQFAIIGPHLLQHPLYNLCVDVDAQAVQSFCYETVEAILTPPGEVIFAHSNDAENAYFTIRGELQYTQNPISAAHLVTQTCTNVGAQSWMSTAALWCCWKHVGTMEAVSAVELLTLNAKGMLSVMLQHPVLSTIFREYGRQFHTRLTKAIPPYADWPSDLEVPFTSYAELVLAMSNELRVIVSMAALSKLRRERAWLATWQRQGLAMLEEEVRIGKSTVMITETGSVERVVAVAVLHLQCSDGRVLVQVGRYVHEGMVACCRLPGKHHVDNELPYEAVQRLINMDLEPFKSGIRWDNQRCAEQADESKESPTFGICTHYVRTACFGFLEASSPLVPEGTRLTRKRGKTSHGDRDMEKNFMSNAKSNSSQAASFYANEVFALDHGHSSMNIYAWLSLDQFQAHQESSTLEAIQTWLDDYEMPKELMERNSSVRPSDATPFGTEMSTATSCRVHPSAVVPTSTSASDTTFIQ